MLRALIYFGLGLGLLALRFFFAAESEGTKSAAALVGFAGAAMTLIAVVSLLMRAATHRSMDWFLAWRYLRRSRPSWGTFIVGSGLLVVGIGLGVASHVVAPAPIGGIDLGPSPLSRHLLTAAIAVAAGGSLVFVFGVLQLFFSVFSTISVMGVYLGTAALVVVISVMGGFEEDLRKKILGTRSHIVVTKPKAMFGEYREVLARIQAMQGVKAVSPFLESEVMVTSQSNLSAVLVRGIDPGLVQGVTDLASYLKADGASGRLNNLRHPELLAKIPAMPFGLIKPMVTRPLGKPPSSQPASLPSSVPVVLAKKPGAPTLAPTSAPAGMKVPPRPVYPAVIVGAELARNLRLYLGDDVNLISPLGGMSPAGPIPKSRPFRVGGIFYSGMYEFDTKYVYLTISEAQRFLGLDDEVTGLEIKLDDVSQAEAMAMRIQAALGTTYEVKDWQRLNRNLFSALKLEKIVMFLVLTFIILVASFSIVTNLIMIVLEKRREIGALKAMGASHRSLMRVFIYMGLYIGIIGVVAALVMGLGLCTYVSQVGVPLDPEVYYISRLPVRLSAMDIGLIALSAVALSFAATIYPALRAAGMSPVDALREEA
ncbi:MAG: ABC transporter permease [Deltaproteobacteria bacterium]|nr:ABC transporter permease [Deltaproteobacteria bacterium]